jgi:hypothetical protein
MKVHGFGVGKGVDDRDPVAVRAQVYEKHERARLLGKQQRRRVALELLVRLDFAALTRK